MKILHVGTSDISGGAARATFRIHKALLEKGVDSEMLVVKKGGDEPTIFRMYGKLSDIIFFFRSRLDTIFWRFYRNKTKTLFSPSLIPFSSIVRKINKINPDIVHLHWVCSGMLSIGDISRIKVPIVWTLHDMWAFTGGCHYDDNCGAYTDRCGNCKVLGSNKENDLSRFIWKNKNKYFSRINNLTIVALSGWLQECALESSLFKNRKVVNLPNPIDVRKFKPLNKEESKKKMGLDVSKKSILFGAMGAVSDQRKGFLYLNQALQIKKIDNTELVVFGEKSDSSFDRNIKFLGFLNNDKDLVTAYSSANVIIVPSLQENLSNAIMESLACGTPVVAFDIGGNKDMIDHKKNGYLAKPFDPEDLARGIEWVLNNENYDELCKNAREKVLREFDSNVVADKYIKLYKDILNKKDA
jgi:glycosyltransferase involved in cell wall biosynthesis